MKWSGELWKRREILRLKFTKRLLSVSVSCKVTNQSLITAECCPSVWIRCLCVRSRISYQLACLMYKVSSPVSQIICAHYCISITQLTSCYLIFENSPTNLEKDSLSYLVPMICSGLPLHSSWKNYTSDTIKHHLQTGHFTYPFFTYQEVWRWCG